MVWQRARKLAVDAYGLTRAFPAFERHGLAAQIQRAAVSVPANIAESSGQGCNTDQARLYQIAIASARELESHLLRASDLGFISSSEFDRVAVSLIEVQHMLTALVRSTRRGADFSGITAASSRPSPVSSSRRSPLDSRPP